LLYPGVNHPTAVDLFGGTDFTAGEAPAEIEEEATRFGGIADRFGGGQLFDCGFQVDERCGAAFGSRKNGTSGAGARSCCVFRVRLNSLRKKCFSRRNVTATAKAVPANKPVIAAVNRCATQNRERH
jgi:hypothetical protein